MIGIDEAGRGAWAGPLVVAGTLFIENPGFTYGLNDSKQLSKKERERLELDIKSNTLFKVVVIDVESIDTLGLTRCMEIACQEIARSLPQKEDIIIDGVVNYLKSSEYASVTRTEAKADSKYPSVMAASILAKVEHDRIMYSMHTSYKEYGFDTNVGYGTKHHTNALQLHGVTVVHRRSYAPIKALLHP